MNRRHLLKLSLATLAAPALNAARAQAPSPAPPAGATDAASDLLGRWTVDLRPSPAAPAYLKQLVITAVNGTQIEGHFYDGTPMQAGRVNARAAPTLCIAFFTDPGEGAYQSSARLVAPGRLEGMTLSTTRGFLLPWVAEKDRAP